MNLFQHYHFVHVTKRQAYPQLQTCLLHSQALGSTTAQPGSATALTAWPDPAVGSAPVAVPPRDLEGRTGKYIPIVLNNGYKRY